MEGVIHRNSTSFPKQLFEAMSRIKKETNDPLRYHQRLVHEYMIKYPHARGILCYHKMGAGKSILGISICETLLASPPESPNLPKWKVLFIASKSLHNNMKHTIKKYRKMITGVDVEDSQLSDYEFISLNASNMITQVYRAIKSSEVDEVESMFNKMSETKGSNKDTADDGVNESEKTKDDEIANLVKQLNVQGTLDNCIVMIDEAHNFFNSITNGSGNAVALYKLIMAAKRIKVIFLTGSPIVNDPFEIGLALNMLAGPLEFIETISEPLETTTPEAQELDAEGGDDSNPKKPKPIKHIKKKYTSGLTLFGEDYDDFQSYFVWDTPKTTKPTKTTALTESTQNTRDSRQMGIRNRVKFIHRAIGLVSYFGADSKEDMAMYPEQLPTIVRRVPMSAKQYSAYIAARDSEIEEASRPMKGVAMKKPLTKPEGRSSSYRVRSRQFSNIVYPEYASKTFRDTNNIIRYEKFGVEKLRPESLEIRNSTGVGSDESSFGLEVYSPKIVQLLLDLERHTPFHFISKEMRAKYDIDPKGSDYKKKPGIGPGVIYSQFKDSGVDLLAKVLETHGFTQLILNPELPTTTKPTEETKESVEGGATKKKPEKPSKPNTVHKVAKIPRETKKQGVYAIISGEVDIDTRQRLVDIFNTVENVDGSVLTTLLVTSTGAEGLDLKNGRYVMVFEPYWHWSRISQIFARIVRMMSHYGLPKADRYVQPYIYLSDYPSFDEFKKLEKDEKTKLEAVEMKKKQNRELTTDVQLYTESLKNQIVINTFRRAIEEASIDCHMHYGKGIGGKTQQNQQNQKNCIMCAPTNRPMYILNLDKDIREPSRCEPIEEEKIIAKTIVVEDSGKSREFRYVVTKDKNKNDQNEPDIKIYEFNPQLNGYQEIFGDHAFYYTVYDAIAEKIQK
jgi:hypothetical protein